MARSLYGKKNFKIQDALVIILITIYTIGWSIILIDKFYSMGANAFDAGTSVYDAGLYMEAGWSIFYSHYTLYGYIDVFFSRGIEYLVSPLTLLRNYDILFVFQSLLIGISGLAIYWIGNRILKSKWISLAIVASYLIYPPLVGTIWPDLHFQILFIPLFLFAYYFYITDRYLISILLFFLASITHGQYSIILRMIGV